MTQEKALAILKSGRNVFLTGSAGAGKTYVLNQYIQYLKERKIPVAVTASTGIAATHMNGMTIHSWSGIGIKDSLSAASLKFMSTKKYLKEHLQEVEVLVIDEISMLHQRQFALVDEVLRYFKQKQEAFGGIQVIVSGDFFQLPPIGNVGEQSRDRFAFMSKVWVAANFAVCYLDAQYRQEGENVLNRILTEIRNQSLSKTSIKCLKEAMVYKPDQKDKEPTKLFTHNIDVDRINLERLEKLPGKPHKFKARTKGNSKLVETLKKSVLVPQELHLKIGAKVMFVRNNLEKGYVNGTLGKVTHFDDNGLPWIETLNGKKIAVQIEAWSVPDDFGKVLASLEQVPLRLAWAITIHKCQGMTLDAAEIDLSNTFELGQGYVALSRLRNMENLNLIGFNQTSLQVDALASKADKRFRELSAIIDGESYIETLEQKAKEFVLRCGGLTNPHEIQKNKKRIKDKGDKKSTYQKTYELLKKELPLEQIAVERGLSVTTIASHFIKIKEQYPNASFDRYRPEKALLKKVDKAKKNLGEEVTGLKPIYEALHGEVTYEDIRMALAFL